MGAGSSGVVFPGALPPGAFAPGQVAAIVLVDVLLAGDNALALLLLAAPLAPAARKRALAVGLGLAVLFRIVLATLAGALLAVPGVSLAGGVFLLGTALAMARPEGAARRGGGAGGWLPQALLMAGVDGALSLDNALALAEVSAGAFLALAIGVSLSALLMLGVAARGSAAIAREPLLARAAVALIGALGLWMVFVDPVLVALSETSPLLAAGAAGLGGLYLWVFTRPEFPAGEETVAEGLASPSSAVSSMTAASALLPAWQTVETSPASLPSPSHPSPPSRGRRPRAEERAAVAAREVGSDPASLEARSSTPSPAGSPQISTPSARPAAQVSSRTQPPTTARRGGMRIEVLLFGGLFALTGLFLLVLLLAAGRMGG